jgi:hypothetical protein
MDQTKAEMALEQLMLAYINGGRSGHIDWGEIDLAFDYARDAWPGRYEEIMRELEDDA